MKMSKTILPALAMLIVSAVMLSTASFAWFAMSTEVSATNMQVSITSDAANLVIATTPEAITDNDAYNTLNWDVDREALLLPTAHEGALSTDFADSDKDVWYTQNSDNPNSSVGTAESKESIDPTALDGKYALVETFYIGVTAGSNNMYDLKARAVIENVDTNTNATLDAIRVLVVCEELETGFQTFQTTGLKDDYSASIKLADKITDTEPVAVTVYIYYDGNDPSVKSVNLAAGTIADANITVYFTASNTAPTTGT